MKRLAFGMCIFNAIVLIVILILVIPKLPADKKSIYVNSTPSDDNRLPVKETIHNVSIKKEIAVSPDF